jgi:predicted nucleic acid-binding protein
MPVEQIYWDSDAFLGWFQEESGKVELCEGTIDRAQSGEVLIVTSALTIAEVLWLRGGRQIPQDKADLVRKFFRRSYIRVRNVTRAVAENAQDLVWTHGIRPKDAIHVATALEAKVAALETFDGGLLSKSGTVGNPGLIMRRPIPPAQGILFKSPS